MIAKEDPDTAKSLDIIPHEEYKGPKWPTLPGLPPTIFRAKYRPTTVLEKAYKKVGLYPLPTETKVTPLPLPSPLIPEVLKIQLPELPKIGSWAILGLMLIALLALTNRK